MKWGKLITIRTGEDENNEEEEDEDFDQRFNRNISDPKSYLEIFDLHSPKPLLSVPILGFVTSLEVTSCGKIIVGNSFQTLFVFYFNLTLI